MGRTQTNQLTKTKWPVKNILPSFPMKNFMEIGLTLDAGLFKYV